MLLFAFARQYIYMFKILFSDYAVYILLLYSLLLMCYVFCIFECLRAPRKMGKCSLGLPSLNEDFIIIIIIIIIIIGY